MVARRCARYPGATVVVVPLVVLSGPAPPVTLVVLHHQPLTLGIKIIDAYGSGIELALQFSAATLSLLKAIRLSAPQIQPYILFVIDLNPWLVQKVPTFAHRRHSSLANRINSGNDGRRRRTNASRRAISIPKITGEVTAQSKLNRGDDTQADGARDHSESKTSIEDRFSSFRRRSQRKPSKSPRHWDAPRESLCSACRAQRRRCRPVRYEHNPRHSVYITFVNGLDRGRNHRAECHSTYRSGPAEPGGDDSNGGCG